MARSRPEDLGLTRGGTTIALILADPSADDQFILRQVDGHWVCPEFELPEQRYGSDTLAELVTAAAATELRLDVIYDALIGLDITSGSNDLIVLAQVPATSLRQIASGFASFSLAELRAGNLVPERIALYARSAQRRLAERLALSFGSRLQQAFESSIQAVARSRTSEEEFYGWSQYLDGQAVGVLSTAQGVLCYHFAGTRGPGLDEALATIEKLQNTDGGWQVRRALVGASSSLSITESTCTCLAALMLSGHGASPAVARGLDWLESAQEANGGWKSSAAATYVGTFPTAMALRGLHEAGRADPIRRGVTWLIKHQNPDGGWGADEGNPPSHPAHTAHALIAIARVAPTQTEVIERACSYLTSAADLSKREPWEPITNNFIVDSGSRSRLEYKHFSTPWVVAALCTAGRDVSDETVQTGTARLLDLNRPDGTWSTSLAAADASPLWAIHDALYALRAITNASAAHLAGLASRKFRDQERQLLERVAVIHSRPAISAAPSSGRRGMLQLAWLSALTVAVGLLVLIQLGVLQDLGTASGARRVGTLVITVVTVLIGALGPPIAATEYRLWRDRQEHRRKSDAHR